MGRGRGRLSLLRPNPYILVMKNPNQSNIMTFSASVKDLFSLLGPPSYRENDGEDQINYQWELVRGGESVRIYDWKVGRPLQEEDVVEWHIFSLRPETVQKSLEEIQTHLTKPQA